MERIQKAESCLCFRRWNRKGYSAFASMHKSVTIGVLWVGMVIVSLAANKAYASPADTTAIAKEVAIEQVGVSQTAGNPTRSAMLPTPIFNREVQVAAPLQTLESALRLSPSVDVRERGGKGVQADLSIRGGSFDQTQVMLNGINFSDARTGHQTHSLPIDIESIGEIELIDGVSGVGAYAGAINLRTQPIESQYMRVEMSGGAHGYGYGNLSGSHSTGRLNIYGAASYRRSDGYTHNTDFANWNGYLRATYQSEKAGYFDIQTGYQNRQFGANGFYSLKYLDQYESTETALGSFRWVKDVSDNLKLSSSVSYRKNYDHFELIRTNSDYDNYHMTNNLWAELNADYSWAAGQTTVGADYTYNQIWSTNLGIESESPNGIYTHTDDRNAGNYYLRHTKGWGRFSLSGSAGVSTSQYGTAPMWGVSGRYRIAKGWIVEAGANESMRLPTFTDLYYSSMTNIPNPDLEPETAVTYRVVSRFDRDRWSSNIQLYMRDGRNLIDWTHAPDDEEGVYYSRQITELKTWGAEWSGSYRVGGFVEALTASYGYITQDKESGEVISLYAQNYMRNKVAASLTLRLSPTITWVTTASYYDRIGNYTDASGATVAYSPYALLDSRVTWSKGKVRLYVDATNITATNYFDYGGLQMPGCWVLGGVVLTL